MLTLQNNNYDKYSEIYVIQSNKYLLLAKLS